MLNKAVIDLNVIRENALAVKRLLPKKTGFCVVVKADAYGHGAEKVANALYGIADCFAVALPEEGAALRLSGIDKDILVLTRVGNTDLSLISDYGLIATACGAEDIRAFALFSERSHKPLRTHIKFNTGMNRQGITGLDELKAVLDRAAGTGVKIEGLYSHYACPENDEERNNATSKFLLANNLVKHYNNNALCHISASGGVLSGEFFDMVRVGLLLYGYKPFPCARIKVTPAMRVYAPVVCERTLSVGEGALYGLKKAEKPEKLSLIRYGYADGLPRMEIERSFNNACMDVTAFRNLPRGTRFVNVLDDAEKLAAEYGTIVYELLTKAALRAEKIYLN